MIYFYIFKPNSYIANKLINMPYSKQSLSSEKLKYLADVQVPVYACVSLWYA